MPVDKMDLEMFVYGQAKECRPTADRQQPELENCDVWELNKQYLVGFRETCTLLNI